MRFLRITFCLVALLAVAATSSSSAAEAPRPNVVYFLVDDMGRADCGFMGGKEIRTPQIDKLAAAGARLDSYYVQPLCSPTRAALLTGRYPMRYGLQQGVVKPWAQYGLPLEETTLADDLKTAGYVTGIFGKWHLGHSRSEYLPTRRGFARQYGHYNGALDYFTHERDGGFDWHKDDRVCRDEGYSTELIGREAAKFVSEHAGKQPFFLYVPFNGVHSPYQPPKGGAEAYAELSARRRNYAAMLTAVDEAIGGIVAAVEQSGARDNTLFVFSSDNGGPAPGRTTDNGELRGAKGGLYEGGVRVAALATWDGHIPAGTTNAEPMHIVDWRPTLQALCGAKPSGPTPMDGRDVWPTLTAGAPSPHEAILINATPRGGALRMGDWKLVAKPRGRRALARRGAELYNLREDPREQTDLAAREPEKLAELQARFDELAREAVPPKNESQAAPGFKAPAVWGEAGATSTGDPKSPERRR
jgi:arylsulfatase A-like enzyme